MKVLVSGGAGFVGLNIVEALLARGDTAVVLGDSALPSEARRAFEQLPGTLAFERADVSDGLAVQAVLEQQQPDAVVHAAAITSGETREFSEFDRVVDVNLKGTAHMLAAALAQRTPRMIYVSSGSSYGEALLEADTISEDTPAQPDSLYAITKHASERLCVRYRTLRALDVIRVRLGSVFGPWERDTGVRDTLSLPFQILNHARAGTPIVLPQREPRRDWIYSRDVAAGVLRLIDSERPSHDLYNLTAGLDWTGFAARWCAALSLTIPGLRWQEATPEQLANVHFLGDRDRAMMSIERIRNDLGFRAAFGPERAVQDLCAWLAHPGRDTLMKVPT
jgi:nucleoside-diphosphate-sugar epimerase